MVSLRAAEFGIETMIVDFNVDTVLALQAEGKHALYGDATLAELLKDAGVARAAHLIMTVPDLAVGVAVVTAARAMNPKLKILARARYQADGGTLEQSGADAVCYDEAEASTALSVVLRAQLKGDATE
jgi:CPA2 family monovalent cation:H+ antiporter-2